MTKKFDEAHFNFIKKFHYCPQLPSDVDFDQDDYANELNRCIEDNFDYTIEKYGTIPKEKTGWPEEFVD